MSDYQMFETIVRDVEQITAQVKQAVSRPDRVFLINRVDGTLITPTDIGSIMRVIEGRGV